ncbi:MAG: glycosyltransferase family 39 protein, partial [Wenzhouxiangellaceae bacterium]
MSDPNHIRPLALTLLLAGVLLLPSMATMGMFFDGMIYASLSRNLALGIGSAWVPYFSEGLYPEFRQHPPLVFWLQASLFALFGDRWWVERLYDLGLVIATALLLRGLWRQLAEITGRTALAGYWWLALLCWILVPKWSWAYRNNVLENTLTLICLAAVVLLLVALRAESWRRRLISATSAGLLTVAGVLVKGPVALFVVAAPVLLTIVVPGAWPRRTTGVALTYTAAFVIGALVVFSIPEARWMLDEYQRQQLMNRVGLGQRDAAMLLELLTKLAPMVVVAIIATSVATIAAKSVETIAPATVARARRRPGGGGTGRTVAAMLALGLSASLPLALGDFDSAHYLLPALPYYAIAFGLFAAARLDDAGLRPLLERKPGA